MRPEHAQGWPRQLPHRLDVPQVNLFHNLAVSAQRFPDHAVVIDDAGPLAYRDLLATAERLAAYLAHTADVRRGDRVAIYMQNSREWIAAYFAVLRLGAVVLPINPMNKAGELAPE